MAQAPRPAHVRYFSKRQKRGRRRASPRQIIPLRLSQFADMFRYRYGAIHLPNDDAGRDDIEPVMHHIAALPQPARRAQHWLRCWAPWLTLAEEQKIITDGIAGARTWTADQLAWRYRITREERDRVGLTTFGAIDFGKAARTKRRKDRDRQRKAAQRRAKGAKPRAEYEKASKSRTKPWIAAGISRRTWYRRQASAGTSSSNDTGPATA